MEGTLIHIDQVFSHLHSLCDMVAEVELLQDQLLLSELFPQVCILGLAARYLVPSIKMYHSGM